MAEWFLKNGRNSEGIEIPAEVNECLTNNYIDAVIGNEKHDCLMQLKIYDFIEKCGLEAATFLGIDERMITEINVTESMIELLFSRAECKAELGMIDEAIDDCNQAISLDPACSNAYAARGNILLTTKDEDDEMQAIKDFERAVQIDNNIIALVNLGVYY